MKFFLYVILLPCALGVEKICSNGIICPEGTYCCETDDGTTSCCDSDNATDFITAKNYKKAILYSSAVDAYHFPNISGGPHRIMNTYCTKDCGPNGLRPCCSGQCCPFIVGTCCSKSCCNSGHHCCGDVTVGEKEWCCPYAKSCSTYMKGLCVGGTVSLIPSVVLTLVISIFSMVF